MKRKLTAEEVALLAEMSAQLATILTAIGLVEYRYGPTERVVFYDSEPGGLIDATRLKAFAAVVGKHYTNLLLDNAP